MPQIETGPETETPHGWSYALTVFHQGRVHPMQVTLSFQDYDLWSRGRVPPYRVVEAAIAYFFEHESPERIPSRCDCSLIRRRLPEADQQIPGRIGHRPDFA